MNDPQSFRLVGGRVLDPDPIAAMFNPATPVQSAHMIIAAIMVTGYLVAAVHALGLLRGRRGPGQRAAFLIPFQVPAADHIGRVRVERVNFQICKRELAHRRTGRIMGLVTLLQILHAPRHFFADEDGV